MLPHALIEVFVFNKGVMMNAPIRSNVLVEGTAYSIFFTEHLSSNLSRPAMENIGLSMCGRNSMSPVNYSDSCNQLVVCMCSSGGYTCDYWSNVLWF